MIERLRIKNFKSWEDTGAVTLAPLTCFFGANSSGKTSLLQMLLLMKQTIDSKDRKRVLDTGDANSLVDLGTFYDLIHNHETTREIEFEIDWRLPKSLRVKDPQRAADTLFDIESLAFKTKVLQEPGQQLVVSEFSYAFGDCKFGMRREEADKGRAKYSLISDGYQAIRTVGRAWPLPPPYKSYGFPDEASGYYQNTGFLSSLVLEFEELLKSVTYLGPLREYPRRSYLWGGDHPSSVGFRGESVVPALLASAKKPVSMGYRKKRQSVQQRIGYWLQQIGLIHSYTLMPIAEHRKDYELRVKTTRHSPDVLLTDVGFGVSQILPVLVLCYHVPPNSILVLEQPEIHLHPRVQAGLADVFIEVVRNRDVQIIVESHSEHLLRRLQRRVAEDRMNHDDTAIYFCQMPGRMSTLERLRMDMFGEVENWPQDFFGDELGEVVAATKAAVKRKTQLRDAGNNRH